MGIFSNTFLSLRGKQRRDFCDWQSKYYQKFNDICVVFGSITYMSFLSFDIAYGKTVSTISIRSIGLLFLAVFLLAKNKQSFFWNRYGNHIIAHMMAAGTVLCLSCYQVPHYAGDSFIMVMLAVFLFGFSSPFETAVLSHILLFLEIVVTNPLVHYPEFSSMMFYVILPSTICLCFAQFYVTSSCYSIYLGQRELLKMSCTDQLTGLYNRRMVENLEKGTNAYVLMADIDFFKKINDSYGHEAGDAVLVAVGKCLREFAGEKNLAIRWGGEEFLLFLYQKEKPIEEVGEALRLKIESLTTGVVPVTVSIGMFDNRKLLSMEKCVECADKALYEAKESGRNRSVLYKEAFLS